MDDEVQTDMVRFTASAVVHIRTEALRLGDEVYVPRDRCKIGERELLRVG